MNFSIMDIARMMNNCVMELHEEGEIEGDDIDTVAFYKFAPDDVECVHFHKKGSGDGIWFRLKDGRVFSKTAEPAEPDSALYDSMAN